MTPMNSEIYCTKRKRTEALLSLVPDLKTRRAVKFTAVFTLACFLFSFICSEPLHAVLDLRADSAAAARFRNPAGDLLIPQSCGRITDGRSFGSRQVVINIQDLHCHPEVQRNIANILGALDREYGLTNVFVEGGYGDIDTSRLCNIADRGLKKEMIENLIGQGKLTGTEYYSISAGKPHLLKGLEDEAVHKANIVRLGKILDRQEHFAAKLKELDRDLEFMKARYFSPGNRIFDRLVEKHREGGIATAKYYRLLNGYIDKINENPDRYNNIFAISREDYPNMQAFLETSDLAKHLRYGKLAGELRRCVQLLKEKMPYSEYNALVGRTDNFTRVDVLMLCLSQMARDHRIDLDRDFPELREFVSYTEKSSRINPIALLQEEKWLVGEIRLGLSEDLSELEVSFLSDFYQYFQDYLRNRITADDYAYFTGRFDKFRATWGKYAFKDRVAELAADFPLLDEFYKVNCERNGISLKNIEALTALAPAAGETQAEPAPPVSRELLKGAEIVVVVTGGFHTEGLKALFEQQKISYLTITPTVTRDTQLSSEVYTKLAKFQAGILEKDLPGAGYVPSPIPANSLALALATQLSSKALFELAIEAVNKQLQAVSPEQRKALLDEIAASTGVTYRSFDEKSGIVIFDNGAQIRLEDAGGQLKAAGVKPAEFLSGPVQAALDGLVRTGDLAAAAGRAMAGNADGLITLLAKAAAEHDLLRDNNELIRDILDDPALQKKDVIDGVAAEILARFPEELQKAGADYERGRERLAAAVAQQDDWLQTVLALELLLGRGEDQSAAASADTKKDGSKKLRLGAKFSILLFSLIALIAPAAGIQTAATIDSPEARDAAAAKKNAAGSRFHKVLIGAWIAGSVIAFAYGGVALGILYALTLMMPIYGLATAYEILFTETGNRESAGVSVTPQPMPAGAEWPAVTIDLPIFNEPWSMIGKTLQHAVETRDRYNQVAGENKANIVVNDDGLNVMAGNDIPGLIRRHKTGEKLSADEENAIKRIEFAEKNNIVIVARPKNGTEFGQGKDKWKFEHRGTFKKAGGVNHSLILADRIDAAMHSLVLADRIEAALSSGRSYQEALGLARLSDNTIAHGKPIFGQTYVQGELRVGDFLLSLDKDSTAPRNGLLAVMPEFVRDPSLSFAQVTLTVNNSDTNLVSKLHAMYVSTRWKHLYEIRSEKGFVPFFGRNGILRKSAMQRAGYYSEYYSGEDVAMAMDLAGLKDPETGRQYHGKFIKYRQPSFKDLLAMDGTELYALAGRIGKDRHVQLADRINAQAVDALAGDKDQMLRRVTALGVERPVITAVLNKAVSPDELSHIALAVLLYEEATLEFSEGVPENPHALIFQTNKFAFNTLQLVVNPVKEWGRKGILDETFKRFMSNPDIPWQEKFDQTFWMLGYSAPFIMVANLIAVLALVFTGASFAYIVPALLPLAFDFLMKEPAFMAAAIRAHKTKEYAKDFIPEVLYYAGTTAHLSIGAVRYLFHIRDTAFTATPLGTKKTLAVAVREIGAKLRMQFVGIAAYLGLLGGGLLLNHFGYLPIAASAYPVLAVAILLAVNAALVPFVYDSNIVRSLLHRDNGRQDSGPAAPESAAAPSGLSADEYAQLKGYVEAFAGQHSGLIATSPDKMLASLVDENRFAPVIRPPSPQEKGLAFYEWSAQIAAPFYKIHRDLVNVKGNNEDVRRIMKKLYERKLLVKRQDMVRDYFRKLQEHPDKLSQEEKEFLDGIDIEQDLVSQGITLAEIEDYSSSRVFNTGAITNRVTLEKDGKELRFFLKGLDRHLVKSYGADSREGWHTELNEVFAQDLLALLGMHSVVATYSREESGDPLLAGFTLLQEIPGAGANALMEYDGMLMRLRQQYVPFKEHLMTELASLAVVSDLLHKPDRRIVQNGVLTDAAPNEKQRYGGNAIIVNDAAGRPSLYLIDNTILFLETNGEVLQILEDSATTEMGLLTAFPGFFDPGERKQLLARYENEYNRYWQTMYGKREDIKALIINTYGADSKEYDYFVREIETDPAGYLRAQEERLDRYLRSHYQLFKQGVPVAFDRVLFTVYAPRFFAEHGDAVLQNSEELLGSLADRNRLSLALYPADPGSEEGLARFAQARNRFLNGMEAGGKNKIFAAKLFLPSREEHIRNFIAGMKDRPANAADPFFEGLDAGRLLQEQGVSVGAVADLSADTVVYRITLERNGGQYTFMLKGLQAGSADAADDVYFDEKDDPLIKRVALSEASPFTGDRIGPVKAVILDWDDTIMYQITDLLKHRVEAILRIWYGHSRFGEDTEQWKEAKQYTRDASARGEYTWQLFSTAVNAAPDGNKSGQGIEQIIKGYTKGVQRVMRTELSALKDNLEAAFTPGAFAFIRELKALGIPLYVVSANSWIAPMKAVEELGLGGYFDGVYSAGTPEYPDFTKEKVVADILSRNGWKPEEVLVIGDSIKDLRAARAHGARFLGVVKNETALEILTAAGAEALLPLGAWFAHSQIVRENDGAVTIYPGTGQKAASAKAGAAASRKETAVQAGGVIGHVVRSADLPREQSAFVAPGAPYAHLWFTDMPAGAKKERLPGKSIVIINGRTVEVGYEAHHGSVIFYMDLRTAGIAREDQGKALQEGAAQLARYFGGTDNLSASRQAGEFLRDRLGSSFISGRKGSKPLMLVDHTADAAGAKIRLEEQGINTVPVIAADTLVAGPAEELNAEIRERLVRRNAVSAMMGENKILELDYVYDRVSGRKVKVNDIATFKKALKVFNAVGNRQVQEDWETFAAALREGKITRKGLKAMLADARRHGVIVHAGYTVSAYGATTEEDIKKLYDLGFQSVSLDLTKLTKQQADALLAALKSFPLTSVAAPAGVESSAPRVSILLSEAEGHQFKPDDVIDVTIPDTLNEADIERYLHALPLRNTIIFHSGDIAQLIGTTRDPLSRKAFAALFALLSNLGKVVEITTPEQARRLAYNTVLKDGLSYSVADELPTDELKQAFFQAMKERTLIRDRLAEEDRDLAAAYEEGRYKFNNREFEEILGKTLLKRSQMGEAERRMDQAAAGPIKANSGDNLSTLVFGLHEGILQGKARPGSLSAVADILVMDAVADYKVRRSSHIKDTGTVNIQSMEALLQAA